jgi:hypothetical protein
VVEGGQDPALVALRDPIIAEPAEGALAAVLPPDVRDHRRRVQAADGVGELPVVLAAGVPQELLEAVVGDEGDPRGRRRPSSMESLRCEAAKMTRSQPRHGGFTAITRNHVVGFNRRVTRCLVDTAKCQGIIVAACRSDDVH